MRKGAILTFAISAAFFLALTATAQPPGDKGDKGGPGKGGPGDNKGGFGGKGGGFGGGFGMRGTPGQIMPTFLQERLKLTDDQKKVLADIQKDVDAKLDKMLTDDQKAELKKLKEFGPGFPGGGFPGGGKGGDKGNPPPKGGDKKE